MADQLLFGFHSKSWNWHVKHIPWKRLVDGLDVTVRWDETCGVVETHSISSLALTLVPRHFRWTRSQKTRVEQLKYINNTYFNLVVFRRLLWAYVLESLRGNGPYSFMRFQGKVHVGTNNQRNGKQFVIDTLHNSVYKKVYYIMRGIFLTYSTSTIQGKVHPNGSDTLIFAPHPHRCFCTCKSLCLSGPSPLRYAHRGIPGSPSSRCNQSRVLSVVRWIISTRDVWKSS